MGEKNEFIIDIPEAFYQYVDTAIIRASYLYPSLKFNHLLGVLSISRYGQNDTTDLDSVRQDFLNILYKERIYSETLSIRKIIYGGQ